MLKSGNLMLGAAAFALLAAAGCSKDNADTADHDGVAVTANADAAVANTARPEDDRAIDEMRKPAAVLAFAGVEPGMTVFELEAGDGYYTELLSSMVGENGAVWMHNPQEFDNFLGDALDRRLDGDRLANVKVTRTLFDSLEAPDASVDVVTWVLGPHELYYNRFGPAGLGAVEASYAEIARVLKPGGVFIALDHVAPSGSPESTGDTLHRIDPAIVRAEAAAAGLDFVEESDVLANPDDQYDMNVFDPAVRRKTDRFLHKYKKPE